MVSSIILGNISQQNGRNVITGTSSGGIDTEALMKALTDAKRLPAVQLEDRISQNTKITAAYSDLQDVLTTFQDAANFLRSPPGVQNQSSNVFEYRNAAISNDGALAGSVYMNVTSEPGTAISSYDITVDQLATYNIKLTNTFALADADTDAVGAGLPFNAGVITLGSGAINVTIGATDTLNQVAAKINAVKDQSHVSATVIKVSNGNYRLSLKSTETGAAMNYASPVFNVGYASQIDAVDSQMTIDGTTVSRSSNNVDDVIDGLTFNLLQETPLTDTLTVGVEPDTEVVKSAILNFVNTYNDFRIFAAKQMEIGTDGKPKETALLASSSTLRTALARVNGEVASVVEGLAAGKADRLADLGITFSDFPGDDETPFVRNILNVDEDELDSALASRFDEVQNVFEFDYTSDNPALAVFERTNSLDATSVSLNIQHYTTSDPALTINTRPASLDGIAFSLNIDQTGGIYQATYDPGTGPVTINLDPLLIPGGVRLNGFAGTALEGLSLEFQSTADAVVALDTTRVYQATYDPGTGPVTINMDSEVLGGGSSVSLSGQAGTVLEGLTLIYASKANAVVQLDMTQGIGDRVFNSLEALVDEDEGALTAELETLTTNSARMQAEIEKIDKIVERYREQLLKQFSALESAISKANTLLQSLQAQSNARIAAGGG